MCSISSKRALGNRLSGKECGNQESRKRNGMEKAQRMKLRSISVS